MKKIRKRVKRCTICLKPLLEDRTCGNVDGCPLARKQKEIKDLEKELKKELEKR